MAKIVKKIAIFGLYGPTVTLRSDSVQNSIAPLHPEIGPSANRQRQIDQNENDSPVGEENDRVDCSGIGEQSLEMFT